MTDIEMKFNSVAWEVGLGTDADDPMVYGMTLTTRGKTVQLGSGRLSFLIEAALKVLKAGPAQQEPGSHE